MQHVSLIILRFYLFMRYVLFLFFSCMPFSATAEKLNIAVASNFIKPMKAIVKTFEQHSEHNVVMSFGSSGKFFAQISHGAPYHLFFSADQEKPMALEKAQLTVENSRFTYALGTLVLWSVNENLFTDAPIFLVQGQYSKLAVANPKLAPYGRATKEVLAKLSLEGQSLSQQVVAENIAQAYHFTSTGNADLGFVALSQVMNNGVISSGANWVVPQSYYQAIKQDVVMLKRGKNNQAAHDFLTFMKTKEVEKIMTSFGYTH